MAPNLLSLSKLGYQTQRPMSAAAERLALAEREQSGAPPAINPIAPPPPQAQLGNLMAEQEREAAVNRPGAGWTGRGGQIANLAGAFLHGIASGRATAQIVRYQRMQKQGNDLATAYGMARHTLLPQEYEAYQHRAAPGQNGVFIPSLGFKVNPQSFGGPAEFSAWYKKYQNAYNAASGARNAYVDYIQQNTIPEKEKGAGKRKHRSVTSDIFHDVRKASLAIVEGGPHIPEGYTEAAQEMVKMLPIGHTPQEIQLYSQQGIAGVPGSRVQVSYQTLMGPDGKEHRYEVNSVTGAKRDLGLAPTKPPSEKVSYQTLLGPDNKFHRYEVNDATGAKRDLGLAPSPSSSAHISYQTLLGPDKKYHRYEVNGLTGQKTDLGIAPQPASAKATSPAASNKFAFQNAISDVRNELSHEQSTISSLEGKLPTVEHNYGAISKGFTKLFGGTDPVAQLKTQIAQHKARAATLEMIQTRLENGAASSANMSSDEASDYIRRVRGIGNAPPPAPSTKMYNGHRYVYDQSRNLWVRQ